MRDEQSTLETNNEYLRKKSLEYNDELLSAQDKVSNAIKTGIENVASRAFDPFLSNRMMREAASWDAKEEKIFMRYVRTNYRKYSRHRYTVMI